jgi:hypothetical protein
LHCHAPKFPWQLPLGKDTKKPTGRAGRLSSDFISSGCVPD